MTVAWVSGDEAYSTYIDRFIPCGTATTNCAFSGDILWVTNAEVRTIGPDPAFTGTVVRIKVPGGGPVHHG